MGRVACPVHGERGEAARPGLQERCAAGRRKVDPPVFHQGGNAARQPGIGRHERGGFTVALKCFAQQERRAPGLILLIGGVDQGEARKAVAGEVGA